MYYYKQIFIKIDEKTHVYNNFFRKNDEIIEIIVFDYIIK
jgi:hypothetical protein